MVYSSTMLLEIGVAGGKAEAMTGMPLAQVAAPS